MLVNNDAINAVDAKSCPTSFTHFLDRVATRLRIRLDSYIYHEFGVKNVFWIEIKLDVGAIYLLILTFIFWIYQIYN